MFEAILLRATAIGNTSSLENNAKLHTHLLRTRPLLSLGQKCTMISLPRMADMSKLIARLVVIIILYRIEPFFLVNHICYLGLVSNVMFWEIEILSFVTLPRKNKLIGLACLT